MRQLTDLKTLAGYWVAVFWLWMLLVGEWNRTEWIAGAIAATLTTAVVALLRRALDWRAQIPRRDLASAWTLPWMVLLDFVLVLGGFVRRVRGTFVTRRFEPADGDAARRFGSRGWRSYVTTIPPNAYVVEIDEEEGTVLLHDLVPFGKSEEPAAS